MAMADTTHLIALPTGNFLVRRLTSSCVHAPRVCIYDSAWYADLWQAMVATNDIREWNPIDGTQVRALNGSLGALTHAQIICFFPHARLC